MTTPQGPVVIVGAGHGGAGIAALLRQSGFTGPVTLLGTEEHHPYHRPPLSKKFDDATLRQLLRPEEFYAGNAIDLRLGVTVSEIRRDERVVVTETGTQIPYATLVLATGSRPRVLDVAGSSRFDVHTLRTIDDAGALRRSLSRGGDLAIIGGGYVGMEVAAVARNRGIAVTVIEREDRILARVAGPELSSLLTEHHRRHGVRIVTGRSVSEVRGVGTEVTGVTLDDGSVIDCGTVLVGVGAVAAEDLASAAGLACDGGVLTDDDGRTSDPHVFAIGDVARRPVAGYDGLRRLESIPAATEHAKRAVAAILGLEPGRTEVPWFWSDQFDLKLKIAGLVMPDDRVVTRRSPTGMSVSFFHIRPDGTVGAVEAVDAPADFMAGKKLIEAGVTVDPATLADPSVPLKQLIARSVAHT
ncbi:FAD-dependent oxidoreductase [Gordonia desulfuricans]|uniref:FAD-dependent oxidoreductase n=1 Tax=Gordonia desulfuricans TaxID=89051 RepID=A0A7K3LLP4_9ACTN|nr:FAD-dependent oxidoreductase [Gordonia desulfuricans]NDK89148.1 FAD-dependent oxidoreductase [Gordonia desulfuricans]